MNYKAVFTLLVAPAFAFMSCSKETWVDCDTILDTVLIEKDWNRGAYRVNDSIFLSTGCVPFNESFCDTVPLRLGEPTIQSGNKPLCTLADIYPPFEIYKPQASDTLTVIINGKTVFFKLMCDSNE